jgi:hypothetical protein
LEQFVVVHDFRNIAPAKAANRTDKNDGQIDKRVSATKLPSGQAERLVRLWLVLHPVARQHAAGGVNILTTAVTPGHGHAQFHAERITEGMQLGTRGREKAP